MALPPVDQYNLFDTQALAALKQSVRANSPEAAKAAAQQFEAIFLQMMLKSLRDASPGDELFGSESTRFYRDLHDQQLAGVLSRKGGLGLAEVIERQLRGVGEMTESAQQPAAGGAARGAAWVAEMLPHAQTAAKSLGVAPHFLVGQAALETGWGEHMLRRDDGSPTFNVFNIKAGRGWTGDVVERRTLEYIDGTAQQRLERFRAYRSYDEAFADYADLLSQSPRYSAALGASDARAFAQALQDGGYATDPRYADKLSTVIDGQFLQQAVMAAR